MATQVVSTDLKHRMGWSHPKVYPGVCKVTFQNRSEGLFSPFAIDMVLDLVITLGCLQSPTVWNS